MSEGFFLKISKLFFRWLSKFCGSNRGVGSAGRRKRVAEERVVCLKKSNLQCFLLLFLSGFAFGVLFFYFSFKVFLYNLLVPSCDISNGEYEFFSSSKSGGFTKMLKNGDNANVFGSGKVKIVLRFGENLFSSLVRNGFSSNNANDIINILVRKIDFRNIKDGQEVFIDYDFERLFYKKTSNRGSGPDVYAVRESRNIKKMNFKLQNGTKYKIELVDKNYRLHTEMPKITIQSHIVDGTIANSLFQDALVGDMKSSTLFNILNEYAFLIDFQRDIQRGDKFSFVVDQAVDSDGDVIREKAIYSNLTLRGKNFEIFSFRGEYYDRQGRSIKRMLLKTPVDGARITSKFNPRRKHPILGYTKAHTGVDMAVPQGTPIYASGDGIVIEVVLNHKAYGKYVTIKHNREYSTRYAHMSRVGKVRVGQRVQQRQVIGYVGMTGLATGPHLHYEVMRYGKHINPSSVKTSVGKTLEKEKLAEFKARVKEIDELIKKRG